MSMRAADRSPCTNGNGPPSQAQTTVNKRERSPTRGDEPKAKKTLIPEKEAQLVVVKPDAVPFAAEVRAWIENNGGNIVDIKKFRFERRDGFDFYRMHKMTWNKPDDNKLRYFTNNGSLGFYASGALDPLLRHQPLSVFIPLL